MAKKIAEFQIAHTIFEKDNYAIYQADDLRERRSVWIKTLKAESPSPEERASFKYEYILLEALESPQIIKPLRIQNFRNSYLLVFENVLGTSLKQYLSLFQPDLDTKLSIAMYIADAFDFLHKKGVLLNYISQDSIYIDSSNMSITLVDFSYATNMHDCYASVPSLDIASPELAGKMNRKVDQRSDIYFLGILLYDLFTETSFEQVEFFQSLVPPCLIKKEIPQPLSDVIMKCLARTPENRYQSALGVQKDLQCIQKLLRESGSIDLTFMPGSFDVNETFLIPERLYGRDRELILLKEAFSHICAGGKEWLLIAGVPGIGKTFLFKELHRSIALENSFIISGKFELLQHHIPFSALIQAFKELIREVLKAPDEKIAIYRKQLLAALQANGQILIDIVPELELIIGKQPPVSRLIGEENHNRFINVVIQFLQVFAQKDHPLVLFLDDLQWADAASLECIKELMLNPRLSSLLVIGAYRNQDVSAAHSLPMIINETQKQNGVVNTIHLAPLKLTDICQMVSDTLHCSNEKAMPLAKWIFERSEGNSFFTSLLLTRLFDEGVIQFDPFEQSWEYDLYKLENVTSFTSLIDLIKNKFDHMPVETQSVISDAAAIGPFFTLELLSKIENLSHNDILARLKPAIVDGFIIPLASPIDKLIADHSQISLDMIEKTDLDFHFAHSKIHETASLLDQQDLVLRQHLRIGSFILEEYMKQPEKDELLFETLAHLNLSRSLLDSEEEKKHLAELNLKACLKAKNSAAYPLAYEVISVARSLLSSDSWEKDYKMTYSIYLESTECAFFQKEFEEVEMLSGKILEHATNNIDKAKLYLIKLAYYTNASEYDRVIEIGLNCVELFGLKIPKNPSFTQVAWNYMKLKHLIGKDKDPDYLEKLPLIQDKEKECIIQTIVSMVPAAFLNNKNLFLYLNIIGMQLTLQYGNCGHSSFLYSTYGLILQTIFKDYKGGFQHAETAIRVAESSNNHQACCRAYFAMAMLINHWTHPMEKTTEYLNKCYLHGLDSGELFFLSYITVFFGFADGTFFTDLREANKRLQTYAPVLFSAKNAQALFSHQLRVQLLAQLANPTFRGFSLSSNNFDEEHFLQTIKTTPQFRAVYQAYIAYKSMLLNYFGLYRQGIDLFESSKESRDAIQHFMTERDLLFFHSLNLLGLCETNKEKRTFLKQVYKNQKQLKLWLKNCPQSNLHRYQLVEAEIARLKNQKNKALTLYDDAITNALKNGFMGEAGLANELTAKYYLQQGKASLAKAYIREAHSAYYRWGALSKTTHLEELYPQLLEGVSVGLTSEDLSKAKEETQQVAFDISAVLRASATLSKEIYLDKLLNEILKVVMTESGSDRAVFLMEQEGKWFIQGERQAAQEESQVLSEAPYETSKTLPVPIINFVLRTQEKVVINQVGYEGMFRTEPYLIHNHVKATLCMPVIYQGKMASLIYLESKSENNIFTLEKIRVLETLSAQIATSIENSVLYRRLEEYKNNLELKVRERTEEIEQKSQEYTTALTELKNTQSHLIESEKLAALGQLMAGIAHEVNTPLGAVRASNQNVTEAMASIIETLPNLDELLKGEKLDIFLSLIEMALQPIQSQMSAKEERQFKRALSSAFEEKNLSHPHEMADIVFDMGITKDITGILQPLGEEARPLLNLAFNLSSILKSNQNIMTAVERASKIIFALKSYIHQEKSEDMQPANLIESMESVLTLYYHQLKHNVTVEKHFQQIPDILCRATELSQVWTNLIHNALQAMQNTGSLEINIFPKDSWIIVEIIDSGPGIPEDVRAKIFTPFFTTKAKGEGSGLGLSISKKIVDAHHGEISFDSAPGRTVFSVKLPANVPLERKLTETVSTTKGF